MDIYLNQPHIQSILGVELGFNYTWRSTPVGTAFDEALDGVHGTYPYVSQLLERGVDVLIYVGAYTNSCLGPDVLVVDVRPSQQALMTGSATGLLTMRGSESWSGRVVKLSPQRN